MRKLDDGQHIVVGTPGRVFDMISRKILRPNYIKQFVLDEADEMLSRGFKDQIYDVFRHLNQETQVLLICMEFRMVVLVRNDIADKLCNVLVANTAIFRSEFVTSNLHTFAFKVKFAVLIAHQ